MTQRIYSIYDNKAETAVGPLLQFPADAAAIRAFRDIAAEEKSQVHQHMEDYDLLYMGDLIDLAGLPHIQSTTAKIILTGKTLHNVLTNRIQNTENEITTKKQNTENEIKNNTENDIKNNRNNTAQSNEPQTPMHKDQLQLLTDHINV